MRKKISLMIMALVLAVAMILPACAQTPAEAPVIKWRAYTWEGVDETGYLYYQMVIDEITAKSGGRLQITPYAGGSLGYSIDDLHKIVRQDAIEIIHVSVPHWETDEPTAAVNSLPFMAGSLEDVETLVKSVRPMWDEILPAWHAKWLASWSAAPITLSAPRKVDTVEAWKGLKIRTWSNTLTLVIEALGGTPVTLDYAEVYSATATGIIDSSLWSPGGVYDGKLYEISDFVNLWFILYSDDMVVVNTPAFDALPADLQTIVTEAFANNNDFAWQDGLYSSGEDIEKLRGTRMEVVEISAAEKAKAAALLAPLYDEWLARAGAPGLKWLNSTLASVGRPPYA